MVLKEMLKKQIASNKKKLTEELIDVYKQTRQ